MLQAEVSAVGLNMAAAALSEDSSHVQASRTCGNAGGRERAAGWRAGGLQGCRTAQVALLQLQTDAPAPARARAGMATRRRRRSGTRCRTSRRARAWRPATWSGRSASAAASSATARSGRRGGRSATTATRPGRTWSTATWSASGSTWRRARRLQTPSPILHTQAPRRARAAPGAPRVGNPACARRAERRRPGGGAGRCWRARAVPGKRAVCMRCEKVAETTEEIAWLRNSS